MGRAIIASAKEIIIRRTREAEQEKIKKLDEKKKFHDIFSEYFSDSRNKLV